MARYGFDLPHGLVITTAWKEAMLRRVTDECYPCGIPEEPTKGLVETQHGYIPSHLILDRNETP